MFEQWVRENIVSFGGDPNKITLMGESAGAGSVRVLLGSPPAIGNYRGAISMSNLGGGVSLGLTSDYSTTYSSYVTIEGSYDLSKSLFSDAGCTQTSTAELIACIKQVNPLTLVELPTVARYVVQDGKYVNTEQLILSPKNASTAHVPVMFGVMADGTRSPTQIFKYTDPPRRRLLRALPQNPRQLRSLRPLFHNRHIPHLRPIHNLLQPLPLPLNRQPHTRHLQRLRTSLHGRRIPLHRPSNRLRRRPNTHLPVRILLPIRPLDRRLRP